MIYKVKRFDSSSRPITLDLKQVERKLYESGLSKREIDIIIDGLRGCDNPEEIMEWVKTGKVNNPGVQKIMEETGLSFPAAYIESEERLYSKKKVIKKLREEAKNWRSYSNTTKSIPPHIDKKNEKNFSLLSGIKDWMDKENKRLYKLHGIKTREEIERERQREKQQQDVQKIENFCNLSKQHQILFDITRKLEKYCPSWGDGDEYPCLHLDLEEGNFDLGFQHGPWYSWKEKYWEKDSEDFGIQKIYNLKQSILKDIDIEIKDWKTMNYLEDSDIEEVLNYLKVLKSEIQRSGI